MRFTICILLFFYFPAAFSQQKSSVPGSLLRQYTHAETLFRAQKYSEALDVVEKISERDSNYVDNWLLMAEILHEMELHEKEVFALEKITSFKSEYSLLAFKRLAKTFFAKGQYSLALKNGVDYFKINPNDKEINRIIESSKFGLHQLLVNGSKSISLLDSNVNSLLNEYWPIVSIDDSILYFTRLMTAKNQLPQEDLFMSRFDSAGWGNPKALPFPLNTVDNEGAMTISADGQIILFTACGRRDGKGSCDIYISVLRENQWTTPLNIGYPVNTGAWEAQPSLSADGTYLFFASNRQGGSGGKDIWVSTKTETDSDGFPHFSQPVNLGGKINTEADDYSPFIHADGKTLYFVSNGRVGMGGADIYMSRFRDSNWEEPIDLGYPINTWDNEDGLTISPSGKIALISSNRNEAKDKSKDIFSVQLMPEMCPAQVGYIKGNVVNAQTITAISAEILLENIDTKERISVKSDLKNGFIACLEVGQHYALHCKKDGFLFYSQYFDVKNENSLNNALYLSIALSPVKSDETIVLNNIFFDFNTAVLKSESNIELAEIIDFLNKNQSIKVEIEGYTDNVGAEDYNLKLSEQRAKAVCDFLSAKVNSQRLSYRGFGSKKPIATNETDEGRAKNRRTELRIISF